MTKVLGTATAGTTDNYVTLLEITVPPHISKVAVAIKENNVNAIKWKIEGTIDGTNYTEIRAEQTLAKSGYVDGVPSDLTNFAKLNDPWVKIRFLHKASVGAAQGNTTVTMVGN